jgi:SPP1 gp7 family putative phage head morphogenesis protein
MRLDGLTMDVGEGKRIRELITGARERMQKTIITSDLESLASMYASNTATYQKQQLARQTRAALGIDPFITDRRLLPLTQAYVDANIGYVKGLTDDVASRMEKAALSAIQDGELYSDFAESLQSTFDFSEARATLIARDQTGKLYGQLNASRQRELGVNSFIWRTSEDERVRDEHDALDGRSFSYDDPPEEGLPGEPIQCRCTAEPDFSDILNAATDED